MELARPAGRDRARRVSFPFSHPDYQRVDLPADKALEVVRRDGVTVLPRGLELAGQVVDPSGRPIPGARVRRTSDHPGARHPTRRRMPTAGSGSPTSRPARRS